MHPLIDAIPWDKADLVVEAVSENLRLKQPLMAAIERRVRRDTIIATNSSSLRVGDVMHRVRHRDRTGGMHFSVPAHIMLAVEVTRGPDTSDETVERLAGWTRGLRHVPIVLQRDVPGMLINRLQHAMYREAYDMIERGIVTPIDVDRAVRCGFGMRYWMLGPMLQRDIGGIGLHREVAAQIYPTLANPVRPGRMLSAMARKGDVGVESGRGFYEWDPTTTPARLRKYAAMLEQTIRRLAHATRLTEIDIAIELAHDENIQTRYHFGFQRRCADQFEIQNRGTEVCEQCQMIAQAENRLLGTQRALQRVVLPVTHSAEQNRIGFLCQLQCALG